MKITATLTFHNELEFLPGWFDSVKNYADEVICAAHNPTDGSLEFVKNLQSSYPATIKILEFPEDTVRKNGFSYMKNAAAELATGDWIVSLDADEEMEMTKETLSPFIKGRNVGVTTITKHTTVNHPNWDLNNRKQIREEAKWITQKHWRIYKNGIGTKWCGLIHESLQTQDKKHIAFNSRASNIYMWHYGAMANPAKRTFKDGLYAELLLRIVEEPSLRVGTDKWWYTEYYLQNKNQLEQARDDYREGLK